MNPLLLGGLFKGGAALLNLIGGNKKKKQQDAYTNTVGQDATNYANANTAYQTGVQNQTSQKNEKSRSARASLGESLLRSLGPGIIGNGDMSPLSANSQYSPIDYSGAPQRVFRQAPPSTTGSTFDALGAIANTIGDGIGASEQAKDFESEMEKYRFALQNPGVQQLPTSNVNYSDIFNKRFKGL